jgi:histidinol-phosphate/aromatic aminotransferase/cobyric acid decarboxylase-like protein/imidazoleglycerol phosphate dehydratase HisB
VPLGESFSRLNEYPTGGYSDLRAAAAGYVGVEANQIVVGAGSDSLIHLVARTYLSDGALAAVVDPPTYSLYEIVSLVSGSTVMSCTLSDAPDASVIWLCNPHSPTGKIYLCDKIVTLAACHPDALIVVDEAYVEYGGETLVPHLGDVPNCVVLRTLSKAFGLAALRVGYAICAPEVAACLLDRAEPAPVSGPSASVAAAALRSPQLDVAETIQERERIRAALLREGHDCPASAGNYLFLRGDTGELADQLESKGLILRRYLGGLRLTVRLPAENDVLLAALGVTTVPSARRSGYVVRTTQETCVRVSISLEGQGRARVDTKIDSLGHLLELLAFQARFDLEVIAGGDLEVDEHHLVEDVLACLGEALSQALGDRTNIARFGSSQVPLDEARACAAVDLGTRPHAEVDLAFSGDRIGALSTSLIVHALERFAMQGRFTIHVTATGRDDHHVAEVAFKALGRALRAACARDTKGLSSTKGAA